MKKYSHLIAVMALVFVPLVAQASTFASGPNYTAGQIIRNDLYVAANTVTISKNVIGSIFATGGDVTVSSDVSGDINAIGGNIQILGTANVARVMGGQVSVHTLNGDLLAAGGNVHTLPGGRILGSVYVAGGSVVIDGAVSGDVHVKGGQLVINGHIGGAVDATVGTSIVLGPDASIAGAFTYRSPREAQIAEGATIGGLVSYEPVSRVHMGRGAPKALIAGFVAAVMGVKMLALLGMVALIVWIWRRPALEVLQEAKDRFGHSVLRGAVFMVLTPIAIVLLLMSFVGIIPGVLLVLVYAGLMIMAKVLSSMFLGAWIAAAYQKRPLLHVTWANALGGVILMELISLIPIIGWLAMIAITLAVFGVLATRVQRQIS